MCGCGGARGAHPDPLSPSLLQGGRGRAWEGRRSGEGRGGLAKVGPEGAGPGTAGELADPVSPRPGERERPGART